MESDKQPPSRLTSIFRSIAKLDLLSVLAVMAALLTCYVIILYTHFSGDILISVGEPSPIDVLADQNVSVTDEEATQLAKDLAIKEVKPLYTFDGEAQLRAQKNIDAFLAFLYAAEADGKGSDERYRVLKESYGPLFSDESLRAASQLTKNELDNIRGVSIDLVEFYMGGQIVQEILAVKKSNLEKDVLARMDLNEKEKTVLGEIAPGYLETNYFLDKEGTAELQRQAAASVVPSQLSKVNGEKVVEKGKIVSRVDYEILEKLGLVNINYGTRNILGLFLAVLAVFILNIVFMFLFEKANALRRERVLALCLIVTLGLLASKFAYDYGSPYFMPIASVAMITAILFNLRTAITVGTSSIILASLMIQADVAFMFTFLIGGILSVFLLRDLRSRSRFAVSLTILTGVFGTLAFIANLPSDLPMSEIFALTRWAALAGIGSAIITIGSLPLFEQAFNFSTDLRLLDLINLNHPLLRDLALAAPGTYSHSLVVGNMAEQAAQEVGASPLLAKAGGYYHDIGKAKRANFFIENQGINPNPHDVQSPSISRLVITSHVKDGVDMAREHRLPQEVIDIIAQHHGCSIVKYFYDKARDTKKDHGEKDSEVMEDDYRYQCDKPRSKEAAVVMIADIYEATSRSISKLTPNRLDQLGQRVLNDLSSDTQLVASKLSLSDLDIIIGSFKRSLLAQHHDRTVLSGSGARLISGEDAGEQRGEKIRL